MRSFFSVSICLSLALVLVGCRVGAPGPMGRGYSSYDQEFKSAPGPEAHKIGYEYSNAQNQTVVEDMRYAVHDLVGKLDNKLSFSVDELFLKTYGSTAFYNSFDHLLREEMTQQGYLLAQADVKDSVRIDFVAKRAPSCKENEGDDGAYKRMYLALVIDAVEGVPTDVIGGFYEVPTYGYKDNSNIKINVPLSCVSDVSKE